MKRPLHTIPGFGTMKALAAAAACCSVLALAASLAGCTKEPRNNPEGNDNVEITFAPGGLQIDPPVQGDPVAKKTRAGNEALIATDTAFRVMAYPKDAAVSGTPAAQNTYKIADNTGKVATTAVTATGSVDAVSAAPGEMSLPRETYDLYYFSPALAFTAGKVSNLHNGCDYMTVKHPALEVKAGADGKYHVASVQFARLCARLDVKISAKANAFVSLLGVGEEGGEIAGLPASAEFTLGSAALSSVTGTSGTSALKKEDFEVTGTGSSTVLSTVDKDGAIVLPVSNGTITATVELLINGAPVHMQAVLPAVTFEAGYKYLLDLKVDRTGSPSFTLSAEPWTEGGSSDTEMGGERGIGDLREGGIVYWIDPSDPEHYKVVSLDEAPSKNWSEAGIWAAAYGREWSLPSQEDLTDLYNARKSNGGATDLTASRIDLGIAAGGGTAFGSGNYWSASEVTAGGANAYAVSLATGTAASSAKTAPLPGRAVKEMCRNLSANGTANSYITSKAGTRYRFDARVKGNGKATLTVNDPDVWADQRAKINPNDDLIAPRFLAPASAFVVWATGSDINGSVKDVVAKGGFVYFTTVGSPGDALTPGNTLIGVKDTGGNLIWSWHIWATDYDPATDDVPYTTRALVGDGSSSAGGIIATTARNFTMMGRNLGALNNTPQSPESLGLQYQWGRKDPFPAAATTTTANETTPFTSTYPTQNVSGYDWAVTPASDGKITAVSSGADGSIAYAILHPTEFITSGTNTFTADWLNVNTIPEQRDYLWGNPNPTDKRPNTLAGSKSIYDPCPPGYRVPRQDSWTSFSTNNTTVNGAFVSAKESTFTAGSGYSFYCNTANSVSSYYPAGGLRSNAKGHLNSVGTYGYYWVSTPRSGSHSFAGHLDFTSGSVYPLSNSYRSYGFSVRCAKE